MCMCGLAFSWWSVLPKFCLSFFVFSSSNRLQTCLCAAVGFEFRVASRFVFLSERVTECRVSVAVGQATTAACSRSGFATLDLLLHHPTSVSSPHEHISNHEGKISYRSFTISINLETHTLRDVDHLHTSVRRLDQRQESQTLCLEIEPLPS